MHIIPTLALLYAAATLTSAHPPPNHPAQNPLEVTTSTGTYIGIINGTTPHVRQFLNIPYALPPTGDRRWLAAVPPRTNSSTVIDATKFGLVCPQHLSDKPNVFNTLLPGFLVPRGPGTMSEDCLSLAIWTPTGDVRGLPVVVFMTGGGFIIGGANIAYQMPHHWVQRTQSHIVVSINYRVDIMGFPNARGLDDQNLGILDQRRAHEWVRDNIRAFGGDPEKITLWGQSAGAASTEFHAFAYHKDPIAKGFVMTSGTASMGIPPPDPTYANFTFVAQSLGCNISTPESELQCMRQHPMAEIMQFIGQRRDNGTTPALSFVPTPDETVVFSNYTERYNLGLVTKAPAIIGSTTDEGTTLVPYTDINIGPDRALVDAVTKLTFHCPAARTTATRGRNGLTTYRYLYTGNFTNTSPVPWLGAYHSGDLPYWFGTYGDFTEGGGQRSETEVSEIMQDYLLAFMKDPERRLRREGWPETSSGLLMKFSGERRAKELVRAKVWIGPVGR
ncbi:Alpha/Beta hydrolase protein [Aspergillus insuetus]